MPKYKLIFIVAPGKIEKRGEVFVNGERIPESKITVIYEEGYTKIIIKDL